MSDYFRSGPQYKLFLKVQGVTHLDRRFVFFPGKGSGPSLQRTCQSLLSEGPCIGSKTPINIELLPPSGIIRRYKKKVVKGEVPMSLDPREGVRLTDERGHELKVTD